MSIEPLLEIKIIARKPTRKLILSNNLRFKDSSYLIRQRKNTASIVREAKIMAITRPSGAGNSDESFDFTIETSPKKYPCFRGFKALLVMNRFTVKRKRAKDQMNKTTSAASCPEWTCVDLNIDFLYLADRIEHFVIGAGILLAWWVLCRITFFLYMCFSNINVKK